MPSSFHSIAAGLPVFSSASAMLVADWASIGCTPRPTSSPNWSSPASPSVSTATATGAAAPRSIVAARIFASGMPVALPTASAITPSSAPWRSSPPTSSRRNFCSSAVARSNNASTAARRLACDPAPANSDSSANAASTSSIVSEAVSAGAGASINVRQPTPVRRWRSSPDRYVTTIAVSSASVALTSRVAIRSALARRDRV